MNEPSTELELQVRMSYEQLKPQRRFQGCKIAMRDGPLIVRVYSQAAEFPRMFPTPYQLFRFDVVSRSLSPLSRQEAAPYVIKNYK